MKTIETETLKAQASHIGQLLIECFTGGCEIGDFTFEELISHVCDIVREDFPQYLDGNSELVFTVGEIKIIRETWYRPRLNSIPKKHDTDYDRFIWKSEERSDKSCVARFGIVELQCYLTDTTIRKSERIGIGFDMDYMTITDLEDES